MKTKSKFAVAAIALFVSQAALAVNWNVDLNSKSPIDNKNDDQYFGSFTYGGQTYGPKTAIAGENKRKVTRTTVNLAIFKEGQLYNPPQANPQNNDKTKLGNNGSAGVNTNVTYRIYRQKHSGLIANVTKDRNNDTAYKNRNFVKHIVGDSTKLAALPASGIYKYKGTAFTNFPKGHFNYQIDTAKKVGHGSFTLQSILVPGAWLKTKDNKFLDIAATLHTGKITAQKDGTLGVRNGNVTVNGVAGASFKNVADAKKAYAAVVANHKTANYGRVNPKYNINLYGPKAEEVAGWVNGMPDRIGGVAIIGKR
ncbi:factor H binding protein domain-containing protein [Neisseria sp.]|uniref:factor H binding protein domain-containing protein n=1 Tax=Neisseria sp. TaxID=192066 RepID=UPI0035A06667